MIKTKPILCLIILFISNTIFAQNSTEFRKAFTLKIAVDSTNFYQQEIPESKYFVKENLLQIYPGEELLIEADLINNEIKNMKVVSEDKNPEKTIQIKFYQNLKGRKHEEMMLEVKNPFNKKLNYDAVMYILGQKNWIKTSIIPIQPKIMNYEMWNDVILSLVLSNWHVE